MIFSLTLNFSDGSGNLANVRAVLNADLNPVMKMIAAKPISQFLEMLINEMERFRDWKILKNKFHLFKIIFVCFPAFPVNFYSAIIVDGQNSSCVYTITIFKFKPIIITE